MIRNTQRNGFTLKEVLVGLACAVWMLAMSTVLIAQDDGGVAVKSKSEIDAKQSSRIHQALIIFANDSEGRLAVPGLINRLAVQADAGDALAGRQIPGMGPEDESLNTTANLFSALIAQQYYAPKQLVSPIERNAGVTVDDDYDYDTYNPANDSYWDTTFVADLRHTSNVSYGHQPILKSRRALWMMSQPPSRVLAHIGNRGPQDGAVGYDSVTCGPHGNWAGNITFADNHTAFLESTTPAELQGDNLFAADPDRELDSLIAFTQFVKDGKAELQFD